VIGTSAGGLDGLKQFFKRLPAHSGMAFVLVAQLDPTHESMMVELLSKQTSMPVLQAAHGLLVQPDHVYVIPPSRYLTIKHRRLVLSDLPQRHAEYAAIDFALRSLAEDQGENAIGIAFSGTGSHSAAGLKEIKLVGGLVLVQEPTAMQRDQMPRGGLDAGISVDYVLAPEKMPDALIAYARHTAQHAAATTTSPDADTLDWVNAILALIQARAKFDFHHYRKNMALRPIQRRMALLQVNDAQKYVERLRQDADELTALCRDLLVGVTAFFREPEVFNVLSTRVLPDLVRRAGPNAPLRVWVPACSTGEEAYSIAMLLTEQFELARKAAHFRLFATDVDENALRIAKRGLYPDSIADAVSPDRLRRFFAKSQPHHYQICKPLREAVVFAPQNLVSDPPLSKLDLISCRNALLYFKPDIQAGMLSQLHLALNAGGYLLLGAAESIGRATDLFEPLSRKWRVYRRNTAARRQPPHMPISVSRWQRACTERLEPMHATPLDAAELMQRLLLDEFAPAAILVNRTYQILSVQGPVVRYLQIPPGELTRDLLAMARPNLRAAIRAAGEKALRKHATVRDANARVRRNGRYVPCRISVRPIAERTHSENMLLIVFEDGAPVPSSSRRRSTTRDLSTVRQLEHELCVMRNDLQRTIAGLERSNEDLMASHQEVVSMNEELQCANEEVSTSKEELQSLNEELSTLNNQLEEKIAELDTANADLTNLLASTDIAILFVDTEMLIRRFTAPAARLLKLLPTDIDRPLLHLAPKLIDDSLSQEARRVITTGIPSEKEVRAEENRYYLCRILPHSTATGPSGVIVTLIDMTQRVEAEAQSRRLATVLRDSSDAIALLDLDGRITAWNRGAEMLYGHSETEALRMNIADLATEDTRGVVLGVVKRITHGEFVPAFETQTRTRSEEVIDVWVTVTLLRDASGKPISVALTQRDITDRRRAEKKLRTLNAQLEQCVDERTRELRGAEIRMRAVLDAAADAVITINTAGTIVTFNQSAVRKFGYSADEAIGQNVTILIPPDQRARHTIYLSRYLRTREPHLIGKPRELDACRRDGSIFPIQLSVCEIEELKLFVGCIRDLTRAKSLEEEVLNIAMLEQLRIGQELHDGTQQELTGLGLLAQNLKEALSPQGSTTDAELAGRLASGISEANLRLRSLARGLIPVPVDAGTLPVALRELATSTQENYKVSCRLDCPEPVTVRDASTATHLYRIAQEAVSNAVKHAKADTISIRLAPIGTNLTLEVRDNGVGMIAGKPAYGGVGLRIMEHRCTVIGGRFLIDSPEGGGTLIGCTFPRSGRE
jgi:two-component system, chemotaxis family, CheB/CheR fusion protein